MWAQRFVPQESEIDALIFWTDDQIKEKIASKAKICPDGIVAFNKFLPYWEKIVKANEPLPQNFM